MFPKPFRKLIENFASLPSVGPKMAERLVLFLFKQDKEKIKDFAENLEGIQNLKSCRQCFNISEGDLCEICKDAHRERGAICIVEEPLDIISIEKTKAYRGLYHVLGGTIDSPLSGAQQDLKIPQLLKRIKDEKIKEVIIATNPTTEGDITTLYVKRKLQPLKIKITRLARGLSTGGDIEYADEITLSEALTNRKELV
ncbi:MAG: recombination mediator RecR [Candidatus Moranbacteria bacterium]|nr:recombination mediator RecR [Candidatus Moranbacteria bacterium]